MAEIKSSSGGWTILAVLLAIGYCSLKDDKPKATASSAIAATASTSDDDEDQSDTSDSDAIDDSDRVLGGETYADYDQRRDALGTGLFSGGDECTEDCTGHEAGRSWAERRGITSADECGGNSWSFVEGCRAYADEQNVPNEDDSAGDEL